MIRPVVKNGGIEVSAIGPDESVGFAVESDRVESTEVSQRFVEIAL